MKFEVIKRSHVKRNILISVVVVLVLSAIILTFTRAKYRTTQSMPLLNGTINYTLADLNIVAMYVDGEQVDTVPDGKYTLTSESYCTNEDNEKDESITISYDSETKGLSVSPMTKKGTKCYLYFVERLCPEGATACNTIMAASRPQGQTTDWTNNGQGVTYYYTGANPDNWFYFGGFWWRIIRINGDGTIRMIYQGTSANTTGTGTQIGTSAFNSSFDDNMYVGFKYTSNQVHGTGTNSTILTTLNDWYSKNLADEADYIDGNAGFCGDRTPSTSSISSNGSGGTGTTATYYGAYIRLYNKGTSNSNPSLQCDSQDVYTTTDSSSGNKSLQYPIGLVTADEAALTGITWDNANTGSYLYTNSTYWTMSPSWYSGGNPFVFRVNSSGDLGQWIVHLTPGVRPVINIRADVSISSGDGSASNPYVIAT